jgi:hypothetical protein
MMGGGAGEREDVWFKNRKNDEICSLLHFFIIDV